MKITERLNVLRELMKEKKIDAYLVPTDDFHGSEYVVITLNVENISQVLQDRREQL